ncbi:MAG TPA: CHAT domain-containing protein [Thermoanaerobaculia bacterium]|nr:CHAT domain-containing protein [Thermoanaerobaculia bacterium]
MRASASGPHLDAETLAAFAEGTVKRQEIPAVLAHLDGCRDCRESLQAANDELASTSQPRKWWLIGAVAATVAAALAVVFGVFRPDAPDARLVELAPRSARIVEPRLSGGFAYAPYRGPLRAGEGSVEAERLKLAGVAGELVENADRTKSPEAQRAAGVALLLVADPASAMARLREAATSANDARSWNDLAAATYAAAVAENRASLYPEALAAADRALRIDADFAEALFNRALILERLGLADQAREAWERYLRADSSSPWAAEARERLGKLGGKTAAAMFKSEQPRLEELARAGDVVAVRAIAARFPQQSRTWAEWEYLHRWALAHRSGNAAEATAALTMTRTIGEALLAISGESLLREAVRAIETGDARDRDAIAEAQTLYYRGRITYNKQRPAAAEPDLRRAAELYARGGSPMAYVARYFAANTRFDQNDVRGARSELAALIAETSAHPNFAALGAQVRWELALCYMVGEEWNAALPLLEASQATFRRLGEQHHLGAIEGLLASTLAMIGQLDDAWAARVRSFAILTAEGQTDRLTSTLNGAVLLDTMTGRLDCARALLHVCETAARAAKHDVLLATTLVRESVLATYAGDDARATIAEARTVAERIADPMLRETTFAEVAFGEGAALLRTEPAAARERFTAAIDFFRTADKPVFLPEAYLLRARAVLRLGDEAGALGDLEAGTAAVEQGRIRFAGSVTGTGVMDASGALLQEALELHLRRGDHAAAFAAAERAQAQLAPSQQVVTLEELQRRLAGTGAVVLQLAMLPSEIAAMAVSADGVSAARRPLPPQGLDALVAAVADRGDDAASRALFELLIPRDAIAGAKQLIVVPARALEEVPFAALYDAASRRYLVEILPVSVAASAGALRKMDDAPAPRSVVALALEPEWQIALPETAGEVDEVRALYPNAVQLVAAQTTFAAFSAAAAGSDVLHIAGHTTRQQGSGETALVFAGKDRISWSDIAESRVRPSSVVALSACDTLRRPRVPQTRALSLGAGFVAAGAGDVIGTLRPIADRDARELFRTVHRELAAGADAAEAVRAAQMEAMQRNRSWRELAVITSRIPHE